MTYTRLLHCLPVCRHVMDSRQNRLAFKFSLDPVAEDLAALYLVEEYGASDQNRQEFLNRVSTHVPIGDARGFLVALLDCCSSRGSSIGVPANVRPTLTAHLHSETLPSRTT